MDMTSKIDEMVEQIVIAEEVRALKEENDRLRGQVEILKANHLRDMVEYNKKCKECDDWKQFYMRLARAHFSGEPFDELEGAVNG